MGRVAHHQPPAMVAPGQQARPRPPATVTAPGAPVLHGRWLAVGPVRRAQGDPDGGPWRLPWLAVVRLIPPPPFRGLGGQDVHKGGWAQGDVRRRRSRRVAGERQTRAGGHRHARRARAPWLCDHNRAGDDALAQLEFAALSPVRRQGFQDAPQRAVAPPRLEAPRAGVLRWKTRGQVWPARAAAQQPQEAVAPLTRIPPGAAAAIGAARWLGHQQGHDGPWLVGQLCSSCQAGDHSTTSRY